MLRSRCGGSSSAAARKPLEGSAVLGISSGSAAARKPREFRVVLGDMEAA